MRIFLILTLFFMTAIPAWADSLNDRSGARQTQASAVSDRLYLDVRLEKSTYQAGEPVRVVMVLVNPTDFAFSFDGILPLRQSANPPTIRLTGQDHARYVSEPAAGIPSGLQNAAPMTVNPGAEVVIFDADITKIPLIHHSNVSGTAAPAVSPLARGRYSMVGDFLVSGFSGGRWQTVFQTPEPVEFEIR